jgi:hypothetical protein
MECPHTTAPYCPHPTARPTDLMSCVFVCSCLGDRVAACVFSLKSESTMWPGLAQGTGGRKGLPCLHCGPLLPHTDLARDFFLV